MSTRTHRAELIEQGYTIFPVLPRTAASESHTARHAAGLVPAAHATRACWLLIRKQPPTPSPVHARQDTVQCSSRCTRLLPTHMKPPSVHARESAVSGPRTMD